VRVVEEGKMMAEVGSLAEGKEDRLEGEGDRQQDRKDGVVELVMRWIGMGERKGEDVSAGSCEGGRKHVDVLE
jgi:hypothetical protein